MSLSRRDSLALMRTGRNLGVDPISFVALTELESNTNPNIWGGDDGKYHGLIQFGPGARQETGLVPTGNMTIEEQLPYVEKYFAGRGFEPGKHGVTEMYRTVLVGNPFQSGTDSNNTNSDRAAVRMMPGGDLYERARKKLEMGLGQRIDPGNLSMTTGEPLGGGPKPQNSYLAEDVEDKSEPRFAASQPFFTALRTFGNLLGFD